MNLNSRVFEVVKWHWKRAERKNAFRVLDTFLVNEVLEGCYEDLIRNLRIQLHRLREQWGLYVLLNNTYADVKHMQWDKLYVMEQRVQDCISNIELQQFLYSCCIFQLYQNLDQKDSSVFLNTLYCEEIKYKHALDVALEGDVSQLSLYSALLHDEMNSRKCKVFRGVSGLSPDIIENIVCWVFK